ncbi:MAG: tetratricopeptide repeat protein [Chloroflexi bacterium]|nr:tetratricopeptide repeat protein [Chloroflexota bacterium]
MDKATGQNRPGRPSPVAPLPYSAPAGQLDRLVTLLRYASGGTWALALYDDPALQEQIIKYLEKTLAPVPVLSEPLGSERADPLPILQTLPEGKSGSPVVCFTHVETAFPSLFGYLDLQRETLALMSFRLVFWVTDYGWRSLAERAPNFYSRLSSIFDFQTGIQAGIAALRQELPMPEKHAPAVTGEKAATLDQERREKLLLRTVHDLESLPTTSPATIAGYLVDLGHLYYDTGRHTEAAEVLQRAATLYGLQHRAEDQAMALFEAGRALMADEFQARRSIPLLEEAVRLAQAAGGWTVARLALRGLGDVYYKLGNLAQATEFYRQAQQSQPDRGNPSHE